MLLAVHPDVLLGGAWEGVGSSSSELFHPTKGEGLGEEGGPPLVAWLHEVGDPGVLKVGSLA